MDFAISRPFHRHRAAILALLIAIYLLIPSISLAQSTSACLSNPVCASSILGASGGTVGVPGGGVGGAVAVGVAASLAAGSVVTLYGSGDLQDMWDTAEDLFCSSTGLCVYGSPSVSYRVDYRYMLWNSSSNTQAGYRSSNITMPGGFSGILPEGQTRSNIISLIYPSGNSNIRSSSCSGGCFSEAEIISVKEGATPILPSVPGSTSPGDLASALAGAGADALAGWGSSSVVPQAGRKLGWPLVLPDGTIIPAGTTVPAATGAGTQAPTNTGDSALDASNAAANTSANTAAAADAAAAAANAAAEAARAAEDMNQGLSGNIPQAQSIEPSAFSKPNFLSYGLSVFSAKFPLDIIGTLPSVGGSSSCPTFIFFDEPFELCFIKDAVVALKIPAIISFVIWAILAL